MAARGVFRGHGSVREELPVGLRVWKLAFPPSCTPPPSPTHPDCVLHWVSGQRSLLFQAIGLFSLPSLFFTPTCRTSHAWRLSTLSSSSHLENKAAADAKTHIRQLSQSKSASLQNKKKLASPEVFSSKNRNTEPLHIVNVLQVAYFQNVLL